ncbi:AAA family [Colletotrichum higginsianum IMI 349063]|uniref:AAA family n=1 Tax=Colletotrichum higginsianum (strain IMI 349063) TaxID=759273 RepID=A0A1B7XYR8_COLHI|nr:AAA family [Colletotrichum higginsianum IMI 349063]OBR04889.1 AAA family [Colletotrichum higginsianum IMI 349063]
MSAEFRVNDTSKSYRDCFVVEYLAYTLCAGEDDDGDEAGDPLVIRRPPSLSRISHVPGAFPPISLVLEAFRKAIVEEQEKTASKILFALRGIVKLGIEGAFAVSKELAARDVITSNYLWTLLAPGERRYTNSGGHSRPALQAPPFQLAT